MPEANNGNIKPRLPLILGGLVVVVLALWLLFFGQGGAMQPAGEGSGLAVPALDDPAVLAVLPALEALNSQQETAEIWAGLAASTVLIPEDGLLAPDDYGFMAYFDRLYEEKERYYGREIELSGLVLIDEHLGPGEFMLGRNFIWCCESDSYFVGFLLFGWTSLPADGSLVRVRGWLEPRQYTDPERGTSFEVPAIRVSRLEAAGNFSINVYPVH